MENKIIYNSYTNEELEAMTMNELWSIIQEYYAVINTLRRRRRAEYSYGEYSNINETIKEIEKEQDKAKQVYKAKEKEQEEIKRQEKKEMIKKTTIIATLITVIVIAVIYFISGLTFVKVGDYGIAINKFSGDVVELKDAGFYWNEPISHKIMKTSIREHTGDIMDGKNDYATDQANTSDNVQLTYNFKLIWKFEDPKKFFNKKYNLKDAEAIEIIRQEETKALDRVSNKYNYDFIKSNVAQIGEEVTKEINVGLEKYGLKVSSFSIVGFSAPESVEKKIQEKVSKQQEAEASKYEIEKAQNEAKAQKIKQEATTEDQQQIELCNKAIAKGQSDNPACYFGDGSYLTAQNKTATE